MNITTVLIIVVVVGALAFKLYRSHLNSKKKSEEVNNQQTTPSQQGQQTTPSQPLPGSNINNPEVNDTER